MRFLRQTLLVVCLVLPCVLYAQPIANDDSFTTSEDTGASYNIAANDTDPVLAVDPGTIDLDVLSPLTEEKTLTTAEGNFSVDASGLLTFEPTGNFFGTATLSYSIKNTLAVPVTSAAATVTVSVTPVNDFPTVTPIAPQTVALNTTIGPLTFTVDDVETDTGSLTVTASSSNTVLIDGGAITLGGSGSSRDITIIPILNESGSATITVEVFDGAETVQTVFDVTVLPAPPTITTIADFNTNEDTPSSVVGFTIADQDTPLSSLTVAGTSSNTALVPDANITLVQVAGGDWTVQLFPIAELSGIANITLTVSDGAASVQETFTFTVNPVNDLPTITTILPQSINEDVPTGALSFVVGDIETPVTSLSVSGASSNPTVVANVNISFGGAGANRTITLTPEADASGTATITLTVTDGDTGQAQSSFVVTVNPVNDLPSITPIANQTFSEGGSTPALAFTVGDIETAVGSLTVTAASSNTSLIPLSNIVFSGSGAIRNVTITGEAGLSGNSQITVTVTDADGAIAQSIFQVTVDAVNDLPSITSIGNRTINEDGVAASLPFTIGDTETAPDLLTLTATSSNVSLLPVSSIVFGGSGTSRTITATPEANLSGSTNIIVTVTDSDGGSAQTNFTLTVNPVNDLPQISSITDITIIENGSTGPIAFNISDMETAVGSLTVSVGSSNTTLVPLSNIVVGGSGATRNVTVTGDAGQSGTAQITLTVQDGDGATAQSVFQVTVDAINELPSITAIGDRTINEDGVAASLPFTIGDAETTADLLTLTATSSNLSLLPVSNIVFAGLGTARTLTATPTANLSGAANISVRVTDADGGSAQTTFTLTVNPVNDAPQISTIGNVTVNEDGSAGPIAFNISDLETASSSLNVTATSNNTSLVAASGITLGGSGGARTISILPEPNQNGSTVITVTVGDAELTTSTSFTVTVTALDDTPTITAIGTQNIAEDTQTGPLSFSIFDFETPASLLTLVPISSNTMLIDNTEMVLSGTGSLRSINVIPKANQNGSAVITLTVSDGALTSQTNFLINVTGLDDPPTISTISNFAINEDIPSAPIPFTVSDLETGAGSLTVIGSSDSPGIIPDGNITLTQVSAGNWTVEVAPTPNAFGTATITLTVSDGVDNTPTSFTVTVNSVNDLPTITSIGNQSINEDASTAGLALTVGDIETAATALVVTGTSGNTTLVPSGNISVTPAGAGSRTVLVTPAPDEFGSAVITLTVTDGNGGTATTAFTLTVTAVNDAPTITAISNQVINEDQSGGTGLLNFTITDVDDPTLTVTRTSSNTTLAPLINVVVAGSGSGRTVRVTPALNEFGNTSIDLIVSDGTLTATETFDVTVNAVNDAPTITTIGNQTIDEGTSTGPLSFTIGDVETAASSLTITRASDNTPLVPLANIVLGGSGTSRTVTVTPVAGGSGPVVITLGVNDGTTTIETTFTVNVSNVDDPPTISAIADQLINEDNSTSALAFTISDPETAAGLLTVTGSSSVTSLISNSNIVFGGSAGSRTVTVTPSANQNGTCVITVNVSDGSNTVSETFQVTVNAIDDTPTITAIAAQTTNEDTPTSDIPFTIGDAETSAGTLTLSGSSSNATLIPNGNIVFGGTGTSRTVTVTPVANESGSADITVTVGDGGLTATRTFTLTVNPVNDSPTISAIADQTILEDNNTGAITFTIDDAETPVALLTLTKSSSNTTLIPVANIVFGGSGASRTVTVTPANNRNGSATITITVDDGTTTTSRDFLVTVTGVDDSPAISTIGNRSTNEDTPTGSISFNISDPETASTLLVVTASSDNQTLVPDANIVLGGTTGTRNVDITPAANQSGSALITLTVTDGGSNTTSSSFTLSVNSVNDVPQITGQQTLTVNEVQPVTLALAQLTIVDPDNVTADFALYVSGGANYTITGPTTITPSPSFNGVLSVPVFVSDGTAFSTVYNVQITVTPTNDPPVITGQKTLSTNEDQAIALQVSDVIASDPDNSFPTDHTLIVVPGTNYSISGTTITPSLNYNGALVVSVKISDGSAESNVYGLLITVNPVNDKPTITEQTTLNTNEDTPLTLVVGNFTVFDPEPTAYTLTVSPPVTGADYTVAGNTITPNANFSGTLSVPVTVSDGALSSDEFTATVTVLPVNDAPVITGQTSLSTIEDIAIALNVGYVTATDVESSFPTGFSLIVLAGSNYTFVGTTITPALDFVGDLYVNVQVSDGSANSATYPLLIVVNDDADVPVITGQNAVTMDEDTARPIAIGDLVIDDPDTPSASQILSILPGTNYTFDGTTLTPVANFFGTLSVNVQVNDGESNSNIYALQVTVSPLNDAPFFNSLGNVSVLEDAVQQSVNITGISPGPLESETMILQVSTDNTALIEQLSINPAYNGTAIAATMVFKPVSNMSGTATIIVTLIDAGLNPYERSFTVTVTSINDAPTMAAISVSPISEDAPEQLITLTGISPGGGSPESTQTLSFITSSNNDYFDVLSVTPGQSTATLRIKPKPNVNGTAQISVRLQDNGPSSPSPNTNFIIRTFTLVIQAVNDPPVIVTTPGELAEPGSSYTYNVEATDVDGETLTITAPALPSWLTLIQVSNGKATLTGTPPPGATGPTTIELYVTDPSGPPTSGGYTIVVNSKPILSNVSINIIEEERRSLATGDFTTGTAFVDPDANPLAELQITALPLHGQLTKSNNAAVAVNDKFLVEDIASLTYVPDTDYTGRDTIQWNASDGYFLYAAQPALLLINIVPVNDPPVITVIEPETDTLKYDFGSEALVQLTKTFDGYDPDGDDITGAEIGFKRLDNYKYRPLNDVLSFQNTSKISGSFDPAAGILTLTGRATAAEYNSAIQSIQYGYIDARELILDTRSVYVSLSDGQSSSLQKARIITLVYSFSDLNIPNAFTPGGNDDNETWVINSPNGITQYSEAEVKVFNRNGLLLFETKGLRNSWNGESNGIRLPSDTYFYTIDLKYNRIKYTGTVTIIRQN